MTERQTPAGRDDPLGPGRFLWGAATSAFQIEGAPDSDWAHWLPHGAADAEARARGTGHRQRTEADLALVEQAGLNAYRFSVEWSRVVPARGEWNQAEVDRYRRMASRLRERGIEPVVTLHHFTSPAWLAFEGLDWTHEAFLFEFVRFASSMVEALAGSVRVWVTLNEPNVHVGGAFLTGRTPPGRRGLRHAHEAACNMLRAHAHLYETIHAAVPAAAVGIAHNMLCFEPDRADSRLDRWAARLADRVYNLDILTAFETGIVALRVLPLNRISAIPLPGRLDFLGVNYYSRAFVTFSLLDPRRHRYFWDDRSGRGLTQNGWEVYPQGFAEVLRSAARLGVPLVVTENGAAESEDVRKTAYLRDHLQVLEQSRAEGLDIRGYFWWSLLDNYEWLVGLGPRFGLYHVDFDTLERTPTAAVAELARAAGQELVS
ncbi:MAG: glycoside hydrolase family 1 protein [Thermoleophilia bacterium]